MSKNKIIKDSVHGYIEVERLFVNIIDSEEFQRLKWIEQGSFRVLYPSARHDRFVHSIGTFHIAKLMVNSFFENLEEDVEIKIEQQQIERLKVSFLYASLLHDIGHAPFSHTCEKFFLRSRVKDNIKIYSDLIDAVKSIRGIDISIFERFKVDFISMKNQPKPHEIVSATILINHYEKFTESQQIDINLELCARMIIGCTYKYSETYDSYFGIKNCLIRLLNSESIDVDKIDYIIRDTKMSGFDNTPIDLFRITRAATAVKDSYGDLFPAYRKSAIGNIENLFKAKNDENQWIISHPTVVYDSELLKACLERLAIIEKGNGKSKVSFFETLFCKESLTKEGKSYKGKQYRLLSDIDILSKMKEYLDDMLILEYFERKLRRHAVWKSYSEFRYLFKKVLGDKSLEKINRHFSPLIEFLKLGSLFVLNDETLKIIEKEDNEKIKKPALALKTYSEDAKVPFDFVLLDASNSFSVNISSDSIFINFSGLPKRDMEQCSYGFLKDTVSKDSENHKESFFYLYGRGKQNYEILQDIFSHIIRISREI